MSIEEPSAKKLKLSASGNGIKSESLPEDDDENLYYFLGCNEGKENVNRNIKEY